MSGIWIVVPLVHPSHISVSPVELSSSNVPSSKSVMPTPKRSEKPKFESAGGSIPAGKSSLCHIHIASKSS